MDMDDHIVTLIDEEGDAFDFLIIDSFLLGDQEYAVMLPMQDEEDVDDAEEETEYIFALDEDEDNDEGDCDTNGEAPEEMAVLFRIYREDDGETSFELIDDEDEWQRVSAVAIERLSNAGD
jgi:uncharacterized protein YrzB (UPF0473 family)